MLWPYFQIIGHPVPPYAPVELLGGQSACLDLGNAPRLEVVLLMKAHRLAIVGRVGSLYPKVLLVIRAADAHGAEVIYLAPLPFAGGEFFASCRWHVERPAIGSEARREVFVLRIDDVLQCGRDAAVRCRIGALPVLARLDASRALVALFNGGHAKRVRLPGSECAIRI